uniref:Uncharacterized protein n=1 Tax=Cacopsylla melanoneura TaxID=428564 RepID=A0A8D9FI13_9HEMI
MSHKDCIEPMPSPGHLAILLIGKSAQMIARIKYYIPSRTIQKPSIRTTMLSHIPVHVMKITKSTKIPVVATMTTREISMGRLVKFQMVIALKVNKRFETDLFLTKITTLATNPIL